MSVPRYWRESRYRYRLLGEECPDCGRVIFPRGAVCPGCGSTNMEEVSLRSTGRLVTWTVIRNPPGGIPEVLPICGGVGGAGRRRPCSQPDRGR